MTLALVPEKTHATYSASGAERWLSCPASIGLSEGVPEEPESSYAKEGTLAHSHLENALKAYLAKKPWRSGEIDVEMFEHVDKAARFITDLHKKLGGDLLCETKVALDFVREDMYGTVDAAIVVPFEKLVVIDFKYGAGIPVDPTMNPQLIYYALGLAHLYDYNFEEIVLMVIQPRADHDEGPIRSYVMSVAALRAWSTKFTAGVMACEELQPEFSAGDHCRFCPARKICPEISDKAFASAMVDFAPVSEGVKGPIVLPAPSNILTSDLGKVLDAFPHIEKWIEAVKSHALNSLQHGGAIEGYKLVDKRATRSWVDDKAAETAAKKAWGKGAFKTELLSPAQMEKAFGKKCKEWVSLYSDAKSSGVTIAKESDNRPAVAPSFKEEFAEVLELPAPKERQVMPDPFAKRRRGGVKKK